MAGTNATLTTAIIQANQPSQAGMRRPRNMAYPVNFCLDSKISGSFASNEDDEGDIRNNNGKDRADPESNQLVLELLAALDDSGAKYVRRESECCRLQQRENGN